MSNEKYSRHDWMVKVRDIFRMARSCSMAHTDLIHTLKRDIYDPLGERTPAGRRRYPQHLFTYVRGAVDVLCDSLWQEVEFVYRSKDGTLYSTHADTMHRTTREMHESGRGAELADMEACHLWKRTGKPFTNWAKRNEP